MRRAALVLALVLAAVVVESAAPARRDAVVWRAVLLGRSVEGRPIRAIESGDPDNPVTLIVGCIHGDEPAGIAVADRLAHASPPAEEHLVIVPNLNPDGTAAGTRGNAHGVDLNRNFPAAWRSLSGTYSSGPRPLSEPETRVAASLISRIRPTVSIWFHQHLDVVDDSTGSTAVERRFARAAGMHMAPLAREPGSAVTWEHHRFPRFSPFVVELPAGLLAPAAVARLAQAVHAAAEAR